MFELPDAKRVKRSDLFHDDEDDTNNETNSGQRQDRRETNSAEINTAAQPYKFDYDLIDPTNIPSTAQPKDTTETEEVSYAFNLFRPSTKPSPNPAQPPDVKSTKPQPNEQTSTTKPPQISITLRSPSPTFNSTNPNQPLDNQNSNSNSGSFLTSRPESFYFTSSLPPTTLHLRQSHFLASAISGTQILSSASRSGPRWRGTTLPWRILALPAHPKQTVIHIPYPIQRSSESKVPATKSVNESMSMSVGVGMGASVRMNGDKYKKARPSRSRRLAARRKRDAARRVVDLSKSKEEHEREKKSRLNRERKLKRRARERADRAVKRGDVGEDGHGIDRGT